MALISLTACALHIPFVENIIVILGLWVVKKKKRKYKKKLQTGVQCELFYQILSKSEFI